MGNAVGKDGPVQRVLGEERRLHRFIVVGTIAGQLVRIRNRPPVDIAPGLKGPGDFHAPLEFGLQIAIPQIRRLHDVPVGVDDGKSVVHLRSSSIVWVFGGSHSNRRFSSLNPSTEQLQQIPPDKNYFVAKPDVVTLIRLSRPWLMATAASISSPTIELISSGAMSRIAATKSAARCHMERAASR